MTIDAVAATDVNATISYGSSKWHRRMLWLALAFTVSTVVIALLEDVKFLSVLAWIGFPVGIAWVIYEAISVFRPGKPLLVLSPRGIFMRIPMLKTVHIPWHE